MSSRSVQTRIDEPGVAPTHPAHLENVDADDEIGGWKCSACGGQISIDPQSRVEYGHTRLPSNGGRCEHRPDSVDSNGGFGGNQR